MVSTNPSIGSDTTIAAAISSLAGKPVSGALSQTGNNLDSAQRLSFYYPQMSQGFSAQGTVSLTYATLPGGSRVDFSVKAGTLPCTNVSPTVSVTAPAANSLLQAGSATTVTASAADSDGTVAKVELFANGASIGSVTAAPYAIQWTPQAGSTTLSAVATDNAGDATTSSAIAVIVKERARALRRRQ